MTGTTVIPVVDEGMGNSAYLVDIGGGRALAVDASRDLRAIRGAARKHGLSITFAADTHLHADFLSGAPQLAADDGAHILAAAAGGRDYIHRGLADGDEVDLGGLTLHAWGTAGHTSEHLAYLLADGKEVVAAFTGGSLLVGSVARTDLAGEDQAEPLARSQYASLRRLLTLPDDTTVYPTHGAGSFCSAPPGTARMTTIGTERATNHLLGIGNEETFVKTLLRSLGSFPPYFLRLAEKNRRGPAVIASAPAVRPILPRQVRHLADEGAQIVDVRSVASYAAGHIPGSLAIPLRPAFATWLGWLVPDPGTVLVIVAELGQDIADVAWQAMKIGYENPAGMLSGGIAAWQASGQLVSPTRLAAAARTEPSSVIDVRQAGEYAVGHLPGARGIELGRLASQAASIAPGPVVTMCGHGERAATAASLLERAGRADIAIMRGGPEEWQQATGRELAVTA
jgi:hydroxyacylglutathione hydrolase